MVLKTVVIGTGRMGRRHIQVVRNLGLDLVGISDVNQESLDTAIKEFNLPATVSFKDAATLLAKTRPDIVIIATTATTHCEYTCAAAESGAKFILCEKPMAVSLAECDRMLEACAKYGTRLAINHQMRFMEQYRVPKCEAATEKFGGLSSVNVTAGNFGLAMNGSHYFEMFRFLTDEQPTSVQAWLAKDPISNPRGPQFEDRAGSVRLVTESGKRFYMDIGNDQGHGMFVVYTGRNGRITIDELTGTFHMVTRKPEHRQLPTTRYGMPWDEQSRSIAPADAVKPTEAVLEALIKGESFPTGEDGRCAVKALVAAYVSDERGNIAVRLDSGLPRDRKFPWA